MYFPEAKEEKPHGRTLSVHVGHVIAKKVEELRKKLI
jgi:hypothetical protein